MERTIVHELTALGIDQFNQRYCTTQYANADNRTLIGREVGTPPPITLEIEDMDSRVIYDGLMADDHATCNRNIVIDNYLYHIICACYQSPQQLWVYCKGKA